nr:hypothetical protein Iba_chr05cCG9760 [Ipomoea batatas]
MLITCLSVTFPELKAKGVTNGPVLIELYLNGNQIYELISPQHKKRALKKQKPWQQSSDFNLINNSKSAEKVVRLFVVKRGESEMAYQIINLGS